MQRYEIPEFAIALRASFEAMGKPAPSDSVVETFAEVLREVPVNAAKRALGEHTARARFAPKPADLLNLVEGKAEPKPAPAVAKPSQCAYHGFSGSHCPSIVGAGHDSLCAAHAAHEGDFAASERILDELLQQRPAWRPPNPARQRASFLFEVHGERAVLREFDQRHLDWCRSQSGLRELAYPFAQLRADQAQQRREVQIVMRGAA